MKLFFKEKKQLTQISTDNFYFEAKFRKKEERERREGGRETERENDTLFDSYIHEISMK